VGSGSAPIGTPVVRQVDELDQWVGPHVAPGVPLRCLFTTTLPVLRITHLTAEQKVGFSLADNKIALNADWDILDCPVS
jgi:hypothetical protein